MKNDSEQEAERALQRMKEEPFTLYRDGQELGKFIVTEVEYRDD